MNNILFSSASEEWETPQGLFDRLNKAYHFEIDLCATHENRKCEKYYSKQDDALKQEWKGVCWCNPPYGRGITKWVEKAYKSEGLIVMLLPARTDTKWFHDYCLNGKAFVYFLRGRLKFSGAKNSAPFPSVVVVFDNRKPLQKL